MVEYHSADLKVKSGIQVYLRPASRNFRMALEEHLGRFQRGFLVKTTVFPPYTLAKLIGCYRELDEPGEIDMIVRNTGAKYINFQNLRTLDYIGLSFIVYIPEGNCIMHCSQAYFEACWRYI